MRTLSFTAFCLCLLALTTRAQFPLNNYGYMSAKIKPVSAKVTPTKAIFTSVGKIDLTGVTKDVLQQVADAKTDIKKIEIASPADGLKVNPLTAQYTYADLLANKAVVDGLITTENKMSATSPQAESDKNTIAVALQDLDDYLKTQSQYYRAIYHLYGSRNYQKLLFPATNDIDAKFVYSSLDSTNLAFASNFTILGDGSKAAVNPELVAGYVGPFRLAINTLISTTKDTSSQAQSKLRLLGGGGNTTLTISYPLFRYVSKNFSFMLHAAPKFVADFPLFGASALADNTFIGSIYLAPEAFVKLSTADQNLGFFANIRGGWIWGTKTYAQNLGLDYTAFNYGQMNAGVFIGNKITISATMPIFASSRSLITGQTLLTTSFFPNLGGK